MLGAQGDGQLGDGTTINRHTPVDVVGFGAIVYSVSGRVTDVSGNPVSDVNISTGPSTSASTNPSGYYTVTDLVSGTYTLTPIKSGYAFSPTSRNITVPQDAAWQDFEANPQPSGDTHFIDLTISLYRTANITDRVPYENILGIFADAVYEMSNGDSQDP